MLYGAIIGDIAGSIYEFNNIKEKPAEIMTDDCFFTDDTVMTIAVAHALITGDDFGGKMRAWGNRFPGRGYGGRFAEWLERGGPAYNSFGNGSAMRVSPVGYMFDTVEEVKRVAELTALPTHNHPQGIKGAIAVASLVFLANNGFSKKELAEYTENVLEYRIDRCDDIRPTYKFNETCQGTVPQAISAFMESEGFEDCIKLAISLGGDSDTLAAIAGSIAEAYYGVPDHLEKRCREFLPEVITSMIDLFNEVCE